MNEPTPGGSPFDYLIMRFYLVLMLSIGIAFRRMSKDTSDYFRAGGAMPWWLTGVSARIFSFRAWAFTGAAGKVFETGVLGVFYAILLGLCVAPACTCLRLRRRRVITWMEAVRLQFRFSQMIFLEIPAGDRLFPGATPH